MNTTAETPTPGTEIVPVARGGGERRGEPLDAGTILAAAPGVLRIAAAAYVRTATWTLTTTWQTYVRVVRAAASGESAAVLLSEAGAEAREYLRRLLELADGGAAGSAGPQPPNGPPAPEDPRAPLRERGAELLRQSADVRYEEHSHPAYERILGELAPDEARVLRFLRVKGPQPSVDVRAGKALNVGTQLVAPGLTMIGAQAGCRYLDRVPAYLNNIYRLGLIWFSREPLEDPLTYQVLEAQPDVQAALRGGGRRKTQRRSIHLTPFGVDFCDVCLPLQAPDTLS